MNIDMKFDPTIPVADADSETDEIIYRISHDLRASVRALQELPVWILEDVEKAAIPLPEQTERHLELIGSHSSRLDAMLTGLLEYSRIGRMQAITSVKPATVLEDVIEDIGLPAGAVTNELDRGNVQIGITDLQRVFSVLLTNAVRFHPKNAPKIKVTGGPISDRHWEISVTDNGVGIPAEKRDFVLQPMTKLVSRDVDPGAGMGLAILRKIAWTYRGSVTIETPKPGKGTTVRVKLAVN